MIKIQPINTESHTNHQETKYRSTYLFSSKSNQRKMNPPINANPDYTYLCVKKLRKECNLLEMSVG
jgi:hypothetical protein